MSHGPRLHDIAATYRFYMNDGVEVEKSMRWLSAVTFTTRTPDLANID